MNKQDRADLYARHVSYHGAAPSEGLLRLSANRWRTFIMADGTEVDDDGRCPSCATQLVQPDIVARRLSKEGQGA